MIRTSDRKIRLRFVLAFIVVVMLAGSFEFVRRATELKLSLALRAGRTDAALQHVRAAVRDVQLALFAAAVETNGDELAELHAQQMQLSDSTGTLCSISQHDPYLREPVLSVRALVDSYARLVERASQQRNDPVAMRAATRVADRLADILSQFERQQFITTRAELDACDEQINRAIVIYASLVLLELLLVCAGHMAVNQYIKRHSADGEALRESEWFARSTVDALSAQIGILDSSGCLLAVNRAWRELEIASEDSMIARAPEGTNYLAICDTMAGRGRQGAAEIAQAIRAVATGQRGEACIEYEGTVGGHRKWYLCRITRFPGNAKVRIVMAHEDITARKRAEEAAEQAMRDAEAASRAKSAFLANMSHEIRTPMSAILGYAELLLDPKQSAEDRSRCVQVIRRNGDHLLGLINDVLDISKIEANKYSVEPTSADIRQMLSDVVALTRVKAIQKGLNFKIIVDGPVPKEVRTDPLRLKQILVNLLGNAIKFTSSGSVHMRVSCQDRLINSTLHFDVIDTGIGMSSEQISRLFRPFTQADESTTRKFGGTGLGLVISRRFAQLLGGDIRVQSEPGVGTCFSVWVDAGPLGGVRMLPSLEEADLITTPSLASIARRSATRFEGRVLVAEDGEDNQALISRLLKNVGIDAALARNGSVALDLASTSAQPFDLILMDMQMPELDGYGATRQLREKGYKAPIVALTANAMADDRAKCIAAGCDDYLSKPIRVDQLHAMLARYLKPIQIPSAESAMETGQTSDPDNGAVGGRLRSSLAQNEKLKGVLDRFVSRLPERIEEMQRLLREQDLQQLARSVHQMKGAAGGYGFPDITTAASKAEETIKHANPIEAVSQQVNELVAMIRRVDGFPETQVQTPPPVEQPETRPHAPALAPPPAPANNPLAPAVGLRVDSATGLPDRQHLIDRLASEIALARREGRSLSCLAIQVDQVQAIAAQHQASTVRSLMKRIAAVLSDQCGADRLLYRADESHFVMVMPGCDQASAHAVVGELDKAVTAEQFSDLVGDQPIRCVFGVSTMQLTTVWSGELLATAMKTVAQCNSQPPSILQSPLVV